MPKKETVPSMSDLQVELEPNNDMPIDNDVLNDIAAEPPIPDRLSPEWSDYLMTQLHDSELSKRKEDRFGKTVENLYPRVHGLRRLAQLFVGKIVSSEARPLQHSQITTNEGRMPGFTPSTCLYTIVFQPLCTVGDDDRVTYSDVGDCFWYDEGWANTDREFGVYPGPIAATRAEARCLRKALGLVTCSAEELGPRKPKQTTPTQTEKTVDPDTESKVLIETNQINFIGKMSERLNIHPWKFIKSYKNYKTLKEIPYIEAQVLCKIIGDLFKNKSKDSVSLYSKEKKADLGNYTNNWAADVN